MNFEALLTADGLIGLLTLSILEIVLGIDNIIFISILTDKLPQQVQGKTRVTGLALALVMRIIMLVFISYLTGMTEALFTVAGIGLSGRDLILLAGGLFLIYKSAQELHEKINDPIGEHEGGKERTASSFFQAIMMIVLIDIVFSFDSILTAIAVSGEKVIMISAVVISMIIMMIFSGSVATFINKRPTIKVLALSFLLMIGGILVADGLHFHVNKNYVYSALAFSFIVEILNQRMNTNMAKALNKDTDLSQGNHD